MTGTMYLLMMFCAGMTVAVQPLINARLAQKVGVMQSACISFAVGTIALFTVVLATGRLSLRGIGQAQWWEYAGGLLGAFFVTMTIVVVPRIGVAAAMAATIAAQLITGLLLDHFGLFGVNTLPIDGKRIAGALLLICGVFLVSRR